MPSMPSMPDFYGTDRAQDIDFSEYLRYEQYVMYRTITRLELWEKLSKYTPDPEKGFMWSNGQIIKEISDDPDVRASAHSGASMAMCLRTMEFIAKNGWDEFKK